MSLVDLYLVQVVCDCCARPGGQAASAMEAYSDAHQDGWTWSSRTGDRCPLCVLPDHDRQACQRLTDAELHAGLIGRDLPGHKITAEQTLVNGQLVLHCQCGWLVRSSRQQEVTDKALHHIAAQLADEYTDSADAERPGDQERTID